MKSDTVAVHGGYDTEPTTRAVAVPIYQTVAYEFESADHGAALFNLEVEGHRYSRISNPTTAVLERRIAELEGGLEALCVSSGQAALNYAILNLADIGTNIVSVPQLYGTTHTLFAHVLPSSGHRGSLRRLGRRRRDRNADRPEYPRHFLREHRQSSRQYLRHRKARRGRQTPWHSARCRQHRGDADPAAADRLRRRYHHPVVDQISRRPWHHAWRRHRRFRPLPLGRARAPLRQIQSARSVLSRPDLYRAFRQGRLYRALPQRLSARHRSGVVATRRVPAAARRRDRRASRRAPCRERAPRRRIPA